MRLNAGFFIQIGTLEFLIDLLAGINVLVGKSTKNNKRTDWNERTGEKF